MLYVLTHGMKDYFDIINGIIQREKKKEDRVIVIWGHSWEIEQYNLWDKYKQQWQDLINSSTNTENEQHSKTRIFLMTLRANINLIVLSYQIRLKRKLRALIKR